MSKRQDEPVVSCCQWCCCGLVLRFSSCHEKSTKTTGSLSKVPNTLYMYAYVLPLQRFRHPTCCDQKRPFIATLFLRPLVPVELEFYCDAPGRLEHRAKLTIVFSEYHFLSELLFIDFCAASNLVPLWR